MVVSDMVSFNLWRKQRLKKTYLNSCQIYYKGFKFIMKEPQEVFSMLQFNNQQRKDGSDFVFQFLAGAPKFADFLFREYLFYFTNLFIFHVIIYKFVLNSLL